MDGIAVEKDHNNGDTKKQQNGEHIHYDRVRLHRSISRSKERRKYSFFWTADSMLLQLQYSMTRFFDAIFLSSYPHSSSRTSIAHTIPPVSSPS